MNSVLLEVGVKVGTASVDVDETETGMGKWNPPYIPLAEPGVGVSIGVPGKEGFSGDAPVGSEDVARGVIIPG